MGPLQDFLRWIVSVQTKRANGCHDDWQDVTGLGLVTPRLVWLA